MENSGHKKGWERFALSAEVCCFTSALLDISSCVDKVSAQPADISQYKVQAHNCWQAAGGNSH